MSAGQGDKAVEQTESLKKGKTSPLRILPSYLHRPMDGVGALNWSGKMGRVRVDREKAEQEVSLAWGCTRHLAVLSA